MVLRCSVPPQEIRDNTDAFREKSSAAVSGLLALLGIEADPIKSREHILLSNIFDKGWREGQDLDLGTLIQGIQSPGFDKIGVVSLENFFPAKERFAFAMSLNNLLASPGFSTWMEGESLDIQKMLYTPQGKPRFAILSIAHLSDAERMFFVTILLNEVLSWMRTQSGTSSLRALLYMDEVFGYFPPTANPPSKTPMLTLLKQARAFGLGIVLATQNPVDLDYKGLSNAGTWLIGRLQTERDKARVLDGLEGASAAAGAKFSRAEMEQALSALGNRVFLLNNVHEDHPVIFQTRWSLSYLRGPLSREQISGLMKERKALQSAAAKTSAPKTGAGVAASARPVLPPGVPECFVPLKGKLGEGETLVYRPALLGQAQVHFAQAAAAVDVWQKVHVLIDVEGELPEGVWEEISPEIDTEFKLDKEPVKGGEFAELPADLTKPKTFTTLTTELKDALYRLHKMTLCKCADPKGTSNPGETEGDFRQRLTQALREDRDALVEKLRAKYGPKIAALQEQKRKAIQKVEKESAQATTQMWNAGISIVTSIAGAVMGRKLNSATNMSKAGTSIRAATKVAKEREDVGYAQENVQAIEQREADLNAEMEAEVAKLQDGVQPQSLVVETVEIAPKKSEITINRLAIAWTPWKRSSDGTIERA
ncbi:MAG: ATP-binding protein [Planctomycetales bacterium]